LADFNANAGREGTFKPTIGSENLHEIGNDTGVRVVNLTIPKNLTAKIQYSHIVTFTALLGFYLIEKPTIRLTVF
jgi:hypothetical protein